MHARAPFTPDDEVHEMTAMPVPLKWGAEPRRAHTADNFVLDSGSIFFERLHVKLMPDIHPQPELGDAPAAQEPPEPLLDNQRLLLPAITEGTQQGSTRGRERRRRPDEPIDEFCYASDAEPLRRDFIDRKKTLLFRLVANGLIGSFLSMLEILPALGERLAPMFLPDRSPVVYLSINLVLLLIAAVLEKNIIIGGIRALLSGGKKGHRITGDSVIACAGIGVLLHIAIQLIVCFKGANTAEPVFTAPLVFAMLVNDFGLLSMVNRLSRNFRYCSQKRVFNAVRQCGEEDGVDNLAFSSGRESKRVTYRAKADFLHSFIRFSTEEDFCESKLNALSPYVLLISLAAALAGGLISGGAIAGIYCMCAVLVAGIPACRVLCMNLPLSVACKRLFRHGVMLGGWAAAEEFGSTDTVAVAAEDIFPRGSVRMINAVIFSEMKKRDVLLMVCSLALAAGGATASVFEELLSSQKRSALEVEDLRYESEKGISGFVASRRVILGTREMLLERNVQLMPSEDYERSVTKGKYPLYIAVSGVFSGMIVLDYRSDDETERALRKLCEEDISIAVCCRDANITSKLISELYGIPARHFTMLGTNGSAEYDELTGEILSEAPCVLSVENGLPSFAEGVRAAKKYHRALMLSAFLQIIAYGLTVTLVAVLCFLAGAGGLTPAKLLLLEFICFAANLIGLIGTGV